MDPKIQTGTAIHSKNNNNQQKKRARDYNNWSVNELQEELKKFGENCQEGEKCDRYEMIQKLNRCEIKNEMSSEKPSASGMNSEKFGETEKARVGCEHSSRDYNHWSEKELQEELKRFGENCPEGEKCDKYEMINRLKKCENRNRELENSDPKFETGKKFGIENSGAERLHHKYGIQTNMTENPNEKKGEFTEMDTTADIQDDFSYDRTTPYVQSEKNERNEKGEGNDSERSDRNDRNDRSDRNERSDRSNAPQGLENKGEFKHPTHTGSGFTSHQSEPLGTSGKPSSTSTNFAQPQQQRESNYSNTFIPGQSGNPHEFAGNDAPKQKGMTDFTTKRPEKLIESSAPMQYVPGRTSFLPGEVGLPEKSEGERERFEGGLNETKNIEVNPCSYPQTTVSREGTEQPQFSKDSKKDELLN